MKNINEIRNTVMIEKLILSNNNIKKDTIRKSGTKVLFILIWFKLIIN